MKISTLWLSFGLCGVTVGAIVWAQNSRPPVTGSAKIASASKPAEAPAASAAKTPVNRSLRYYDSTHISESMFARPLPPPPAPTPPPPPAPQPKPPTPPPPPDPLANSVYSGTVTLGDQRFALLENTQTKEGKYLKIGDNYLGGTVTQIESGQVTLNMAGTMRMLPKSSTLNLTPLDRSAAFLGGGQNGPGGPGGMPNPGGPSPGNPMPANNGAMMPASMMLQAEAGRALMEKMQMDGQVQILDLKLTNP